MARDDCLFMAELRPQGEALVQMPCGATHKQESITESECPYEASAIPEKTCPFRGKVSASYLVNSTRI